MNNKAIADYAVLGYMEHKIMWWKDEVGYRYVEHDIEKSPNFTFGEAESYGEAKERLLAYLANGWIVYDCKGDFQFLNNVGEIVVE